MNADFENVDWLQSFDDENTRSFEPQNVESKATSDSPDAHWYVDPALLNLDPSNYLFTKETNADELVDVTDATISQQALKNGPYDLPSFSTEQLPELRPTNNDPGFSFSTFDDIWQTDAKPEVKLEELPFDAQYNLPEYDPFGDFYPGNYDFLNLDNTLSLPSEQAQLTNLDNGWDPLQSSYQPSCHYPDPPEPNQPFPIDNLYPAFDSKTLNETQDTTWVEEYPFYHNPDPTFPPLVEPTKSVPTKVQDALHTQKRSLTVDTNLPRASSVGVQVSYDRKSKKLLDPSCDPIHFYTAPNQILGPWGTSTKDGTHLFSYLPQGQLTLSKKYTREEIRQYVQDCPRKPVAWVQQAPAQCNHRLTHMERKCRYANCPDRNNSILPGWLRVVFDEFPKLTTDGTKDPFKVAMAMHLWCFEQCFDPMDLYMQDRLFADDRALLRETRNAMAINKDSDSRIVSETFEPWFEWRQSHWEQFGAAPVPRPYKESLSYALVTHHLDHQIKSRQRTRSNRNSSKSKETCNTIDVHKGDLSIFARRDERRRYDRRPIFKATGSPNRVTQRRQSSRSRQSPKSKQKDEPWKPVPAISKKKLRQLLPPIYTGGLEFPVRDHGLRSASKRRRESEEESEETSSAETSSTKKRQLNSYSRRRS